ncbi:MAG: hypothetical protein HDR45_06995 [Bacteroides sp.]|nr:hypothetical protein [Bacteroides sp.]
MEYSIDSIQEHFTLFWKTAKKTVHYKLNGRDLIPEKVSGFGIQLTPGDYGDGYNFSCVALNLRIQENSTEVPYDANFIIKVVSTTDENGNLTEKIVNIKDNCIYLKKR